MGPVLRARIIMALTAYDRQLARRERQPNIHRLALLFGALERVEEDMVRGEALAVALADRFRGPLLERLLKLAPPA